MDECLLFSDVVEDKSTQLSLTFAADNSIDTVKDNRDANLIKRTMPFNCSGNSYPSGGLENNCSQCTTVRTHDPEQNQDLSIG